LAKHIQLFIALTAVCTFFSGQGAKADETSPALREHISSDASADKSIKAAPDNSVAAFFQVPANQSDNHAEPPPKKRSVGRLVWHVMDNMGIPMIVGKDNDLDPSLRGSQLTPPTQVPTMASLRKMDKQFKHNQETTTEPSTANAVPMSDTILHKIPQSELEGVELPAPRDESGH